MHKIDLSKYNVHSDLIIENDFSPYLHDSYLKNNIKIEHVFLDKDNVINKKKGDYTTISFQDITDNTNFLNVKEILISELKKILTKCMIKDSDKVLIIGLGNSKSTPDSLGFETLKNITVTRHLYEIGDVDTSYRNVSIIEPNVIGNTGIESKDVILGVVEKIKPDFIIAIDSLSASNIDRVQTTIQITNTGIHPGSGIGNDRGELSKETLGIPVIAIGVPTVVSSLVIVRDTLKYLMKKISYHKHNYEKDKLVSKYNLNYQEEKDELTSLEKENLLGILGTLDEGEIDELFKEVLNPIGYNLIVSTKEIDFVIEKLGKLLGEGLNESLHEIKK